MKPLSCALPIALGLSLILPLRTAAEGVLEGAQTPRHATEPAAASGIEPRVEVADYVDLSRYQGLWYELARTPNIFQIGCVCTTAAYALTAAGGLELFNGCNTLRPAGFERTIDGVGVVVDPQTNAKLLIGFSGAEPTEDYWILDVVDDPEDPTGPYRFAAIGGPRGDFLFILGRAPALESRQDAVDLLGILRRLAGQAYDLDRVMPSRQPRDCDYRGRDPF